MIRMLHRRLLLRYSFGKRRLCEEVHLNLAYRWFPLGGHGLSTPLFSAGQVGSARKGSGFFACSTPGGVGGQDGVEKDRTALALPRD